jgi:aminoglycoside phosphotransferase (APT) family kinase protein
MRDEFHEYSPITHIHPRLSNYSSTFASYIISVQATENLQHTIFLKDYSVCSRPVQQLQDRRRRELHVYREVLGHAGRGTPKYYGSLWDESQNRLWLFLEFVDGKPAKETGFEKWLPAVRWLGRMYAYSIQNARFLKECTFLEQHDHRFFQRNAEAAPVSVSKFSPGLAERVTSIASGYAPLVEAMVSQPPVLVHGSYRAGHILLDHRTQPPRVCPVDWESAALGAGLFDLAYLSDGFASPQLDEIIEVYRDEVGKFGISIPTTDEVVRLMNCYRLHRNMKWLGWAWNENFSQEAVANLVARAERLAHLVL